MKSILSSRKVKVVPGHPGRKTNRKIGVVLDESRMSGMMSTDWKDTELGWLNKPKRSIGNENGQRECT